MSYINTKIRRFAADGFAQRSVPAEQMQEIHPSIRQYAMDRIRQWWDRWEAAKVECHPNHIVEDPDLDFDAEAASSAPVIENPELVPEPTL